MTDWKTRTHDIDIHLYVRMQKDRILLICGRNLGQPCILVQTNSDVSFSPWKRINGLFLGVLASLQDFLTWWWTTNRLCNFSLRPWDKDKCQIEGSKSNIQNQQCYLCSGNLVSIGSREWRLTGILRIPVSRNVAKYDKVSVVDIAYVPICG